MRDLIFTLLVLGYFASAVFVRACELVVGGRPSLEEERRRL